MAGIAKAQRDARPGVRLDIVGQRPELAQAALGVGHGVQRQRVGRGLGRRTVAGVPLARHTARCAAAVVLALARPLALLFLDVRAVGQHHARQVGGRRGRVDRPAEAAGGQPGQQSRVVDVGVGEDDEIERRGVEVQRARVLFVGVPPALEHPAVDQEPPLRAVDAKARPGHLAGRTEEADRDCAGSARGSVFDRRHRR